MKSDLLVTFVETDTHSNQEQDLIESLGRLDIPYVAFGKGRDWKAFSDKFFYFREGIKKLNPTQKCIIFVDSRDVIFYRGVDEILEKIETNYPNLQVLFNGETNCYPDKLIADKYPNQNKKYKYLNSGMMIARTDFILNPRNYIEDVADYFLVDYKEKWSDKISPRDISDQRVWTQIFLDCIEKYGDNSPVGIDYDCHIFQCLWDENGGRSANFDIVYNENNIYNKLTNTEPCIFHAPGPTCTLSQVKKAINGKWKQYYWNYLSNKNNFF